MGKRKCRTRPRPKRWQSAEMNNATFRMYYEMLEQMAMSIYVWQGLPSEIDKRFLEMSLFNRGLSVFFHDAEYDAFFSLNGSPSGRVNMYNNPLGYEVYGAGDFHRSLKSTECVPIWNNYLRRPDVDAINLYARRLTDIDRTVDTNLAGQKMPIIAVVPEEQRLTYQNLLKQQYGNEPCIVAAEGVYDPKAIQYLSANVPYMVTDLLQSKLQIWNEVMTYFGIDNANISKTSRVQAAEVEANDGQVEAMRLVRLNCRREACRQINLKYADYGLQVWCDLNRDISSKNWAYLAAVPGVEDNPRDSYAADGSGEGEVPDV